MDRTGPEGSHTCWVDATSRSRARALRLVNTPGMKADGCYLGVLAHKRDPFMSCQKQFKNTPDSVTPPASKLVPPSHATCTTELALKPPHCPAVSGHFSHQHTFHSDWFNPSSVPRLHTWQMALSPTSWRNEMPSHRSLSSAQTDSVSPLPLLPEVKLLPRASSPRSCFPR